MQVLEKISKSFQVRIGSIFHFKVYHFQVFVKKSIFDVVHSGANKQNKAWVNQKFCNILVTWGTIRQHHLLLPKSWKWRTTLVTEMPRSPDTLPVLLAGFIFVTWNTASECTVLALFISL